MLIATLPAVYREELIEQIFSHPLIDGARYNSGISSPWSPLETVTKIDAVANRYAKKLWIDLKGRQLRIEHWATPAWGRIILNHEIDVDTPSPIRFRGGDWTTIVNVGGAEIFVDPPPRQAVGQGQSVNILSDSLQVKGYSTPTDFAYIKAAVGLGLDQFMLSFVESRSDIAEVAMACQQATGEKTFTPGLFCKIESLKGLAFIDGMEPGHGEMPRLVAACDDLAISLGPNRAKLHAALRRIIARDPEAVLASGLFTSLEHSPEISPADFSHLALMKEMGFKHFMLCDGICWHHFQQAMQAWKDFHSCFS